MKSHSIPLRLAVFVVFSAASSLGQQSHFQVLAFYSPQAEPDHVQFAQDALKFFSSVAAKDNFTFDSTTDWKNLNAPYLKKYQVVVWLNESPTHPEQRRAFQQYIESGGAWLGFHAAGYNDKDTSWPWFVDFLGGAVFYTNSWPPLPARLKVDDRTHSAMSSLPDSFLSPSNEWYIWKPSPRLNKSIRVLLTFDPLNYPLGLKDVLLTGDLPVVWTNTKYKMLYMNMGHGDKIFTSPTQNQLIEDALISLGGLAGAVKQEAAGMRISPRAIAVNPSTHKVYAVNSGSDSITILDTAAHFRGSVKVGSDPGAIAVNSTTNKIYVSNGGSGTVSVIDGATNAVTATVPVGTLPYEVAVNPTTNKVYVSRTFSNTLTVIDGGTNQAVVLKAGLQADAIAVDPGANKLYLTNYEGNNLTVIDGANDNISTVAADIHLWGIAVNPATNRIYLTSTGSSKMTVIDGKTNGSAAVDVGNVPCAVAIDSVANKIYVANYGSDSVTVIDGASNRVVATLSVGAHPQSIAVNPETHRVFVANTRGNNVTVIDGTHDSVAATVSAGQGPYAIAVDAATNKAYVANMAGESLTVVDGNTLSATAIATSAASN